MLIAGIDPSLTGTGIALINTADFGDRTVTTVASKGSATATLDDRFHRLGKLTHHVTSIAVTTYRVPDLVVIEAPSLAQKSQAGTFDRSGLWWFLLERFYSYGIPVAAIAPSCRAKYATGKGNAGKDEVLAAVVRRYPDVLVSNNNEADALVLAAIGARHLGHPIDDLPKTHLDALAKVAWPASSGVAA